MGPALSTILTLVVFLLPLICDSMLVSVRLSLECRVYRMKRTDSIGWIIFPLSFFAFGFLALLDFVF